MKVTKHDIDAGRFFKGYEGIVIPKGTPTTHQTACGIDENYNFINEFSWIPAKYPLLKHDATFYGANIPADELEEI